MINHLVNILSILLPATRLFFIKRLLYSLVGFKFGKDVLICNCIKSYVLGFVEVGDFTWLGRHLDFTVPKGTFVRIGSNVDVAPYVKFVCGSHSLGPSSKRAGVGHSKSIVIGDGCWIGSSSIILAGAHVGNGSVVAAGAVVLEGRYPDNVLLAGVPAKVMKTYP